MGEDKDSKYEVDQGGIDDANVPYVPPKEPTTYTISKKDIDEAAHPTAYPSLMPKP